MADKSFVVEITDADIAHAGHNNTDDPLAMALYRQTGDKRWWTEIYSRGERLRHGQAWLYGVPGHTVYDIDQDTTKALQEFDDGKPFVPRKCFLLAREEELTK